jgi:hypothetical protein
MEKIDVMGISEWCAGRPQPWSLEEMPPGQIVREWPRGWERPSKSRYLVVREKSQKYVMTYLSFDVLTEALEGQRWVREEDVVEFLKEAESPPPYQIVGKEEAYRAPIAINNAGAVFVPYGLAVHNAAKTVGWIDRGLLPQGAHALRSTDYILPVRAELKLYLT